MDRALEAASASFPNAKVKIERHYAAGLPEIQADRQLCEQVFVNLITNAFQAMDGQERRFRVERCGCRSRRKISNGEPGVGVIVEDSGPGVPPELREQIFNPFFTSKKDGVGLGLSIVAKIVDDHRGTIRLEEGAVHGARFHVFFLRAGRTGFSLSVFWWEFERKPDRLKPVLLLPANWDVILRGMNGAPMRQLADASPEAQHQALLEVAEAIAQHRDLGDLFHELAARLHRVVEFDYLNLILHDAARNVMRLHILESEQPRKILPGSGISGRGDAVGWVWETQQPFILDDTRKETRFPGAAADVCGRTACGRRARFP